MALQVWLPLKGNLQNQGLSNYNLSMFRGTETYNNNGKIGKCFYANGVNTIKILNIIPDFYHYTEYSLCAWFYIEAQNTSHSGSAIISAGNWNNQVLNLAVSNWSTDHYTYLRISGTNWNTTYAYNFQINTWYHVVVSCDGNNTYAYVNGQQIGNTAAGFLPTSIEGNDMCIGGATYYSGMQFFGRINDVRIYNHCLSQLEVKEISQALVVHYKLDQQYGLKMQNIPMATNFSVYNNFAGSGTTGTLTKQSSTYQNAFQYLLKMTPNDTSLSSFQTTLHSHGVHCGPYTFKANTKYVFWIYYKLSTNASGSTVGGVASNIGGWTAIPAVSMGSSWYRVGQYRDGTATEDKTDNIFTSFYTPSAVSGTTIQIYFASPHLLEGTTEIPDEDILEDTSIIVDSSGYNNFAIDNGSVPLSYDTTDLIRYKSCAKFASGARISTPVASSTFLPTDAITVSIWYKSSGATNRFLSCTEGGGWNFEVNSSKISFPFYIAGKGYGRVNASQNFSSDNQWHMLTASYDGISTAKIYLDGILNSTSTITSGWENIKIAYNANTPLCLGAEAQTLSSPIAGAYVGNLSDLRIYATALSDDDVFAIYKTGMKIDNLKNIHTKDLKENNNNARAAVVYTDIATMNADTTAYTETTVDIAATSTNEGYTKVTRVYNQQYTFDTPGVAYQFYRKASQQQRPANTSTKKLPVGAMWYMYFYDSNGTYLFNKGLGGQNTTLAASAAASTYNMAASSATLIDPYDFMGLNVAYAQLVLIYYNVTFTYFTTASSSTSTISQFLAQKTGPIVGLINTANKTAIKLYDKHIFQAREFIQNVEDNSFLQRGDVLFNNLIES